MHHTTETADGAAVDGNIHVGYWDDPADGGSLDQATDRLTDLVAGRLAAVPGQHLLDVGCGTGRPALRIARATGARVSGVSTSEEGITLARTRADEPPAPRQLPRFTRPRTASTARPTNTGSVKRDTISM
ncbi:class I SAM-dependent methyltransferase [Streptomyces sp. NPDC047315]|uniref:SAM-dependent methyltransferase n=1 Tax=Streptomyces sp. NPDC047315 TaxID=3155142 RepID=UPI0033CB2B51